jgi:hypothetical protein
MKKTVTTYETQAAVLRRKGVDLRGANLAAIAEHTPRHTPQSSGKGEGDSATDDRSGSHR